MQETKKAQSIYHQAATASLLAPAFAIGLGILSMPATASLDPESQAQVRFIFSIFSLLILLMGILAGIFALFGMGKYGAKGILWKVVIGAGVPILLTLLAIPAIQGAMDRAKEQQELQIQQQKAR